MWIITTRVPLSPDRFADAVLLYRRTVPARVKVTTGCMGAALLLNTSGRVAESVSYWRDAASAEAGRLANGSCVEGGWLAAERREAPASLRLAYVRRVLPLSEGSMLRSLELRCRPAAVSDGIRYVQDTIEPAARPLAGFRSMSCAAHDEDGHLVISSFWTMPEQEAAAGRELGASEGQLPGAVQATQCRTDTSQLAVLAMAGHD